MNALNPASQSNIDSCYNRDVKMRYAVESTAPVVLSDIYDQQTNIVIWRRELSDTLKNSVMAFVASNPNFLTTMTVTPQSSLSSISRALGGVKQQELSENIAELVDMFCCLFELKRAGLRLAAIDRAMCPKFHTDKIPCRLVTTFQGIATEWLPHQAVKREKLGVGSKGQPDNQSGLYGQEHDIQQLKCGDVGLLKGELWEGNENAGLVHRSPALLEGQRRLLLTLDFRE